ncbi:adenine phosphoribosyltransferase [Naumannella cuiyingiana]|uniref:Adenine phosphoribosyltransferase n=1 Tax=Naumannella cuiyingiana TaxID=1347891 RepID=A0A7Z0D656_9ACTN|nr:adenine phosphoribosyltransferase [Naumannella cuiyingiana]NYI69584.1 adenine phosphoribosyltransferase [Naumannella cuiyingiana]
MTSVTQSPSEANAGLIADLIRDVPDFPKPGIMFKDITPLLARPSGLAAAVTELVAASPRDVDLVVGMEARGFIFAAPIALALGAGFVPVRKPGKLPGATVSETFALEYGTETLTVHSDAIPAGARVLVVDDVLATGGTVAATAALLKQLDAELVQVSVLLELTALDGRAKLAEHGIERVSSVLRA